MLRIMFFQLSVLVGENYTFDVFAKERHPGDTNSLYHTWFGDVSPAFSVNSINIGSDIFIDGKENYYSLVEIDVSSFSVI